MPEFLLEVGCEELPAPWLSGLTEQLRAGLAETASREHLEPGDVQAFSTPRRLVVRAELLARQADREERVWGPALAVARDAAGGWTGAALGFARKNGVAPEALGQAVKDPAAPEQTYLFFTRRTPGRPAADVLPGVLAATLRGLAFPKRMSWDAWLDDGKGAFPFGRPVRWLIALLDGAIVPFTIYANRAGARGDAVVASGDSTRAHRFLPRGAAGAPLRVRSFAGLREALRAGCVLLDPAERAARIRDGLGARAREVHDDHGLFAEWRDLVEHPAVVFGAIPEELRRLPAEVLETVLVHHQKYVPLAATGRTPSGFAAVTNGDGANAAQIVRGMERVVVARLRDAAFFFEEDRKRPLAERVADLEGVTFHQGLGSYREKAERMAALVDAMGARLGYLTQSERTAARSAALLAKADLTTLMVREFTELQGAMGAIYLQAEGGHWASVVDAVRWHYHPLSVEPGSAPARELTGEAATVFGAVSLADKLDTLAGYFGLGLIPSGSSDPYGLRRAAQGAVRVLLDFWSADANERRPSLRRLVAAAVAGYGERLKRPAAEVGADLEAFLLDRLRYVLVARGHAADEVEAVLGAREPDPLDDVAECGRRLEALHGVRSEARADFEALAAAFKRARNILGQAPAPGAVEPGRFEQEAERDLHAAVVRLAAGRGGYEARLRALAGLRPAVDRFFDDVLVMAEDPDLRANRLALLGETLALFYRIADISRLGG